MADQLLDHLERRLSFVACEVAHYHQWSRLRVAPDLVVWRLDAVNHWD